MVLLTHMLSSNNHLCHTYLFNCSLGLLGIDFKHKTGNLENIWYMFSYLTCFVLDYCIQTKLIILLKSRMGWEIVLCHFIIFFCLSMQLSLWFSITRYLSDHLQLSPACTEGFGCFLSRCLLIYLPIIELLEITVFLDGPFVTRCKKKHYANYCKMFLLELVRNLTGVCFDCSHLEQTEKKWELYFHEWEPSIMIQYAKPHAWTNWQ